MRHLLLVLLAAGCGARAAALVAEVPANTAPADDVPGAPTVIVTDRGDLVELEIDGDHVYWLQHEWGTIGRVPRLGGPVEELISHDDFHGAEDFDVDDGWLYWGSKAASAVFRRRLDGGPVETVAADQPMPLTVVVSGGRLYWIAGDAIHVAETDGTGAVQVPTPAPVGSTMTVSGGTITAALNDGSVVQIHADGRIDKLPVVDAYPIEAAGDDLVLAAANGQILRGSGDGGGLEIIAEDAETYALAGGPEGVYFGRDAELWFAAPGREPVHLDTAEEMVTAIALVDDELYWGDHAGTIKVQRRRR